MKQIVQLLPKDVTWENLARKLKKPADDDNNSVTQGAEAWLGGPVVRSWVAPFSAGQSHTILSQSPSPDHLKGAVPTPA